MTHRTLERIYAPDPEAPTAPLATDVAECPPHHFVVESPSGSAMSEATCRKCGITREYRNWLEQYEYAGSAWRRTGS
jgi:hypothetical protein